MNKEEKISKDYILAWIDDKDDLADILFMLVNGDYTLEQFKHDIRLYDQDNNKTYRIGQRLLITEREYIIAQVKRDIVCAIGLKNGNRYVDAIRVGDICKITSKEMDRITNRNEFSLIEE